LAQIATEKIIKSTLNGIDEAMETYYEWSGGEWLWNAPEYFITVKIAENIAEIEGNKYITLEDKIDNKVLEYTDFNLKKKRLKQASKDARTNGRGDIIFWRANGTPRALIEVKNGVQNITVLLKDIERIRTILHTQSTIDFGLIAFYSSQEYKTGNADEKLKNKVLQIKKDCDNMFNNLKSTIDLGNGTVANDDQNAWISAVLLLKRDNSNK